MKLRRKVNQPELTIPELPNRSDEADHSGQELATLKRGIDKLEMARTQLRTKLFASLNPTNSFAAGKRRVIIGQKWVVGYIQPEDSAKLDEEGLMASLDPKTLKQITSRRLDPKKLLQAVSSGAITKKQYAKFVTSVPNSKRIYCSSLEDFHKGLNHEDHDAY